MKTPYTRAVDTANYTVRTQDGELALAGGGGEPDIFHSGDWFRTLAACGFNGARRLAAFDEDGEAAALYLAAERGRLVSLTNFYTMRYAPLVRPDALSSIEALAREIARQRWPAVELRCLVATDETTRCLIAALEQAGLVTHTYAQAENWYVPTAGMTAEGYFGERESMRDKIARAARRFAKNHQSGFNLYTADDGILDYMRVYASSWKQPERFPWFIPALARLAAQRGDLRMGVLYADEQPVAAQLWLVCEGRATIYKVAYDEAFAKWSVGSILGKAMFEHVLEHDRPDEIDYGTGSDAYKRDWMTAKRDLIGVVAFNPCTVGGLAGIARQWVGRRLRALTGPARTPA